MNRFINRLLGPPIRDQVEQIPLWTLNYLPMLHRDINHIEALLQHFLAIDLHNSSLEAIGILQLNSKNASSCTTILLLFTRPFTCPIPFRQTMSLTG